MVQPISQVDDNEHGLRPVIVEFQNSQLEEGEETKLQSGVYRKSRNSTMVAITSKNILYTGCINKDDDKDDLYNRYLLISNRKTGKVRLVAVDTAVVAAEFLPKNDEVDRRSVRDLNSISKLNKEFGSKKIKRLTEQKEKMQMNIDDVKEQLEQTVAGVEMDETGPLVIESAENDSMYRPPINRNASLKEEVYLLDEIVPENVLSSLEDEAKVVVESELDSLEINPLIKERLTEMQNSSSPNLEKCELLLYLDYLMKYITIPAKNITKKFVICKASNEVNSHILDNFSVMSNTGRTRPLSMRDKTICYILVLSMIAFNYEIDLEQISKTVKLGVKKLQEIARVLAFSPSGKNKSIMTLKVPLPPAVSVSPKKRKR